jgi:type I restriction enzyme S subunit
MEFYKETELRETEVGRIPKDWNIESIKDIADVKGGKRLPKGDKLVDDKTPYPYIRILDFTEGKINVEDIKYLHPSTQKKISRYIISSEDVYISIAGTIGLAGLIPKELDGTNLTENAAKLCNLRKIEKAFLAYLLNSAILQSQIKALIGKGSQPKLALFRIEKLLIPFPSYSEQKNISRFLLLIDLAIDVTDSIIQKTQELKKGLMQELLTKGIGHKEFKYSKELGCEMPKEWEAKKIVDLFDVETGTTPSTKDKSFWEEGTINWITPTDLSKLNDEINITISERKITEKAVKECSLSMLPKDSIILSTRAPVGYVAVLNQKSTFNQGCKGLIPRTEYQIDSKYYCYFLISRKDVLENYSGGSTFKELSKQWLENLSVPYLSFKEQQLISNILMNIDNNMEKEKKTKAELEILKKGLMQSLLTGQVRMKVN